MLVHFNADLHPAAAAVTWRIFSRFSNTVSKQPWNTVSSRQSAATHPRNWPFWEELIRTDQTRKWVCKLISLGVSVSVSTMKERRKNIQAQGGWLQDPDILKWATKWMWEHKRVTVQFNKLSPIDWDWHFHLIIMINWVKASTLHKVHTAAHTKKSPSARQSAFEWYLINKCVYITLCVMDPPFPFLVCTPAFPAKGASFHGCHPA